MTWHLPILHCKILINYLFKLKLIFLIIKNHFINVFDTTNYYNKNSNKIIILIKNIN
jgi:hypothetical protein